MLAAPLHCRHCMSQKRILSLRISEHGSCSLISFGSHGAAAAVIRPYTSFVSTRKKPDCMPVPP